MKSTERFACPKCGNTDELDVVIMTTARIRQYGPDDVQTDVDESMDGSHEWDGDSTMHCCACGHSDKCSTFDSEWEPEPIRCASCGTQGEHIEVQAMVSGVDGLACCGGAFSCPKCGTSHNSTDYEDEGEYEEAGRTFRYCSEHCMETH